MKLIKYDPYINNPWTEIDQIFGDFFRRSSNGGLTAPEAGTRPFRINLEESEEGRTLYAELPGISREDVQLELEKDILTIQAKRTEKAGETENTIEYKRQIRIGEDIDSDKIKAEMDNGLLKVDLPKEEARKPKTIEIA